MKLERPVIKPDYTGSVIAQKQGLINGNTKTILIYSILLSDDVLSSPDLQDFSYLEKSATEQCPQTSVMGLTKLPVIHSQSSRTDELSQLYTINSLGQYLKCFPFPVDKFSIFNFLTGCVRATKYISLYR